MFIVQFLIFICDREFHEVCLDEIVYFAVHDTIYIRCLVVGAMVLDAAVVEDIRANLAAPFYLFLTSFNLGLGLLSASAWLGHRVESAAEPWHVLCFWAGRAFRYSR